jgi:hypothetical protein
MRWLIIDEISIISAALLAQVKEKLRDATRKKFSWKVDAHRQARPFGGISILLVGDFHQLPSGRHGFMDGA